MPADATVSRSKHATLVANTAYWVAFSQLWDYVEVKNRDSIGGDRVSFVIGDANTTAPTDLGDNTIVLLPGESAVLRFPQPGILNGTAAVPAVKLIPSSTGTPEISVTGYSE